MGRAEQVQLGQGRRKLIVAFLESYTRRHPYPPTFEEIGAAVGCSKSVVRKHLDQLEKDGIITRVPMSPRTIVLLKTA